MRRHEFKEVLDELEKYFPALSDEWQERWFKSFSNFNAFDVLCAVDAYTEGSAQKPTIAQIKALTFDAIRERKRKEHISSDPSEKEMSPIAKAVYARYLRTAPIEILLDILEPAAVHQELQTIIEKAGLSSWSELSANKEWIKSYKAKMRDLIEHAKHLDPTQFESRYREENFRRFYE